MRTLYGPIAFSLIWLRLSSAIEYVPFVPGTPNNVIRQEQPNFVLDIFRRGDSKCGTSCANMGADVCCGKKASCALDQAGNVACCPSQAVCTGSIAGGQQPGTITSAGATVGSAAAPTAAPSAAISHAISGSSTVANAYYPFPVLPTKFANAGECSASYTGCQAESAKCTGFVEGGGYGVTVNGAGGGVTQQGVIEPSSAEAICSSLSQEACHGLQLGMCSTLGGASAQPSSTDAGFVLGSTNGAMPTPCVGMYGMGVGIAMGIVGQAW